MLLLERPYKTQPGKASAVGLDSIWTIVWNAANPATMMRGGPFGSVVSGSLRGLKDGAAWGNGYLAMTQTVTERAQLRANNFTTAAVIHFDGTNAVPLLSARPGGQATIVTPTGVNMTIWGVADVLVGGAPPTGVLHVVSRKSGNGLHDVWINGVKHGTTVTNTSGTASVVNLAAIGAHASSGTNVGAGALTGTSAIFAVHHAPNVALSDDECLLLSSNVWALYSRRIWVPVSVGGGAASISPAGIPTAEAFGTASLARASVASITLVGVASAEAFGTSIFTRRQVNAISPTGIASAEAFGTAVIGRISVASISPTGIPSAEAFGAATFVATLPGTIQPTGIPSAEAFGAASFARTARITLSPAGIPSDEAFGAASFVGVAPASILPASIPSEEAFGTAQFDRLSLRTIQPTGIASLEAFGAASFLPSYFNTILPQGIPSAEVFGAAILTHRSRISAEGIPTSEAFGTPSFSRPGAPSITLSNRFIGPRVGLRANGELIILF